MQWTNEQYPAIHSRARKLLIQAFAGTGKTTMLVGYATHHASMKMLYLCCGYICQTSPLFTIAIADVICIWDVGLERRAASRKLREQHHPFDQHVLLAIIGHRVVEHAKDVPRPRRQRTAVERQPQRQQHRHLIFE